jgi:hypothetical protein
MNVAYPGKYSDILTGLTYIEIFRQVCLTIFAFSSLQKIIMSAATTAAEYISTLDKISKLDEKYFAISKLPEATKQVVVIYGVVTSIRPPKKSITDGLG